MKRQARHWLSVIPVLLLAAALAAIRLDAYPLSYDEWASLILARGATESPIALAEVWTSLSEISPDQAYGMPLLYWVWGRVFGWSTFALRLLPWFAGLLTLAWVYRAGRDMFAPLAGWAATLFLATSVNFITYMHLARSFTMAALFAALTAWSYWRLSRRPAARFAGGGRDHAALAGLFAGSLGIFYSHYYSVLLLVALGCWHLLFQPKERRWWPPVLAVGIAGLAFLLQLNGFLLGLEWTQTKPWHTSSMIRATEVLPRLLYLFTNGLLSPPILSLPPLPNFVALMVLTLVLALIGWRLRRRRWFRQIKWLLFTSYFSLLLMVAANEVLQIVHTERMRYFIALWPLGALLLGWGVWILSERWRWLAGSIFALFVVWSIPANLAGDLQEEIYSFQEQHSWHPTAIYFEEQAYQRDFLLIGARADESAQQYAYTFPSFPPAQWVFSVDAAAGADAAAGSEIAQAIQGHLRVWLLAERADSAEYREMSALLPDEMVLCQRVIDRKELALELYARSSAHCPVDQPPRMVFGAAGAAEEEIALVAAAVEILPAQFLRADLLMHAASAETMPAYSLALHLFDLASGELVAQGDQGLWLGRYNPIRGEIDISALPAGQYELRIGLYEWQTLARIAGMDQRNGWRGEMLPLYRFEVK